MGISDEDYARALKLQQAFAIEQMKLEMERQREEARMSISGATGLGNLVGAMGQGALQSNGTQPYYAQQQAANITISNTTNPTWASNVSMTQSGTKVLNEQDLKHDAMLAPLSALIDMWMMRWQGEWVSETDFQEDDFWRLALIRLVGANKLEKHHLANQYAPVYRIIE